MRTFAARSGGSAHRVPLGLLLLSRGQLTYSQLRMALEAQRAAGRGRIGEWLRQLGFASEQQVTAALGLQWACPVFPLRGAAEPGCVQMLPMRLLESFQMMPVHYVMSTRVLYVAFCERIDYTVLYAIEQMLQCRTEPCLVTPSAMQQILDRIRQQARSAEVAFERLSDAAEMARITRSYVVRLDAEDLRIAACGEHIWVRLTYGQESMNLLFRASDATADQPACHLLDTQAPLPGR